MYIQKRKRGIIMGYTPEDLYRILQKTVIGQDDYIKSLATTMWLHDLRIKASEEPYPRQKLEKHNMLIIGPTGSGKTLAVQTLARELGYDLYVANATDFSGTGWKGRDVEELISDLYDQCKHDSKRTMHGIIFIDEIDKVILGQREKTEYRTFSVENALLKLVEGYRVHLKSEGVTIDASNILFICAGAFEGIEKIIQKRIHGKKTLGFGGNVWSGDSDSDLILQVKKADLMEFGVGAQFIGRFSRLAALRELNKTDLTRILLDSRVSVVKSMDATLKNNIGVRVTINQKGAEAIALQAIKEKTGARGLSFIVQEVMNAVLFLIAGDEDVNEIQIIEKDGEPAIRLADGPRKKRNSKNASPVQFHLQSVDNIELYVDNILEASKAIHTCDVRQIRAIHALMTSLITYMMAECNPEDQTTEGLRKLIEAARDDIENPDMSICEHIVCQDKNTPYAKLYKKYKYADIDEWALRCAIDAIHEFEMYPDTDVWHLN